MHRVTLILTMIEHIRQVISSNPSSPSSPLVALIAVILLYQGYVDPWL